MGKRRLKEILVNHGDLWLTFRQDESTIPAKSQVVVGATAGESALSNERPKAWDEIQRIRPI